MNQLRPIQTAYNGRLFRSRLEARWAVFFDVCRVRYEYEPEGYRLSNGQLYLPDFLLHDVTFNHSCYCEGQDLYVEVKGCMTPEDEQKILCFSGVDHVFSNGEYHRGVKMTPLYVVGNLPVGNSINDFEAVVINEGYRWEHKVPFFNFFTVDGDDFPAMPGVGKDGKFHLFGADSCYFSDMDPDATERAYRAALSARFEHGERPSYGRYRYA